jgi:hypothetical protein
VYIRSFENGSILVRAGDSRDGVSRGDESSDDARADDSGGACDEHTV